MADVLFLLLIGAFFGLTWWFTGLCERL